jgi:ubiquinone/menaquinone biosynthesis C-methylase UbiE
MEYTIEETDLERQHLLARFLEPISLNALKNISLPTEAGILDIGCGLGDTTLMLNERFPNSTIIGLDGDGHLIEKAIEEKKSAYHNLDFVCADALHLPFEDNRFDFVFCRYILHHITDAMAALVEMKRVCKDGGLVFAQEYDANFLQTYPESDAYPKLRETIICLFADALIGRKMVHYFKNLSLKNITHNAQVVLADNTSVIKKFYSLTAKALSKAILENALLTRQQLEAWIEELEKIEEDKNCVVLTHPIIAVWGTKQETLSSNYIYHPEK